MEKKTVWTIGILLLLFSCIASAKFIPGLETICDKSILIGNYTMRYCP
jgi:hypothetical protein